MLPDRPADEVRLGPMEPSGHFVHHPARYIHLEAYNEEVFDQKVIELWNTPEGTLARWRWLKDLSSHEAAALQEVYVRSLSR